MRVSADGYIDVRDGRRVRTPGMHAESVDPMPEAEAVGFLLSHSFPGHRRIVRSLTVDERRRIQLAAWADSVSEKMSLLDRVWRAVTQPVIPPTQGDNPVVIQVVQMGPWAYPICLDGASTRVMPHGGLPVGELEGRKRDVLQLDRRTA